MTNQGDDKGRPDANRAEGSQAHAGILKKRKPRSLDEEAPLETKPPWSESPAARLSGARAAVPSSPPPPPPAPPAPPSPPGARRTLSGGGPTPTPPEVRGSQGMQFSREVLSPPSRPGSFAPSPGSSPNSKGTLSGGEKKLGRGSLDEGLLEAFVYDEEPTRSSEPSSSAGAPLKPRRAVGSSLFGEASASWRRSAQHSAHHPPSESPGSGGHKAEELGGELRLEALSSQGEPLGFLSEDEEEPLDLLEPPKPQGKQGRALPMDDDLFGGTDDGGSRLDDDEVPFSDDPYPPPQPSIPKPAALKPSRAQEPSLFDFSDEGYSLDPHDDLSLPSEDALDLDAPMPPPRGAQLRARDAYSPVQLGLEEPEDRFEEDIYDLDLPSELPPKGTPRAAPPKGRALDDSLGDSLGAISDLPPVKTEREEHDVSRIYQEEDLKLDPIYTQDLEPPRPSGPGARVVAAPELEGLVERAVEARLKAALASVSAPMVPAGPEERAGVAPLLPSDWGKGEEAGSTGRSARLDFFLGLMRRKGSHDLHLHAGHKPALRLDDKLVELPFRPLTPEDWARLVRPATPPAAWLAFSQHHDADFLYEAGELGRMRVNLFRGRQGPGAVIQAIPETARSLGELGLPPQVERLASLQEGLCLLLGPSGSGVSTTAAALLEHINQTSARHIITLEDPIEYVFEAHKSLIQQREIGVHAHSHAAALRAALRERPDVVFLGEISDTEVWSQALDAAAMGTLVLAVSPSRSLGEALERLETFIPAEERDVARVGLADSLSAVLCQRLLPRASGGKVPVVGLYLPDPALRKALRGGELGALGGMLANAPAPSLPLDQHLAELHAAGAVTREAALDAALDPSDLDKRLG